MLFKMETMRKNPISEIMDKVSFVNYLPLLARATSDNDEAVPGYLYQEIENISLQPEPNCQFLVDYLAQRLDRPSAAVKMKVLKIMNHLTSNGPKSFRQHLRKKDGSIKMATSYHEAPNPLTGTSAAEDVRKQSKDLLQLLFDAQLLAADESSKSLQMTPSNVSKLGGLGNSKATRGKYEGFGSSPLYKEDSFTDKMLNTIERWATSSDQTDLLIQDALSSSPGKYEPVVVDQHFSPTLQYPVKPSQKPLTKISVHVPGKAGGRWDDDLSTSVISGYLEEESAMSAESSLEKQEAIAIGNLAVSETGVCETNISPESSLVQTFCTAGQLPCSLEDIRATGQRCTQLNVREVMQTIVQVFESYLKHRGAENDEQQSGEVHVTRAMLLLEWLLHTDVVHHPTAAEMCCPTLSHISSLDNIADSKHRPTLQAKAEKLLLILQKLQALPV